MNKTDFIAAVAEKANITKVDAAKVVNAYADVIKEEMLKGEKVAILGFGTFSVTERAARQGINPQTKQPITIAARKSVKFKPGSALDLKK